MSFFSELWIDLFATDYLRGSTEPIISNGTSFFLICIMQMNKYQRLGSMLHVKIRTILSTHAGFKYLLNRRTAYNL